MTGAPLQYRILPRDPGAQLFEVTVEVPEPDPAGQVFAFPAWIPGSYLIRDYARNVVAITARAGERAVPLGKIDKSRWRAEPCRGPLTVTLEIYAGDLGVRGAHLDTTHAFFNGVAVFPRVDGQEARPVELEILPPPGNRDWKVATSMRSREDRPFAFGRYHADSYDELIDHPVEIGELAIAGFEVGGIPHTIAVRGHERADLSRIRRDLSILCQTHMGLLGRPADLDRYLFLLLVLPEGYGGLEHRWSSSLVCARADLPVPGEAGVKNGYRKFLGLCSHEYFHLWNIKRMKPQRFTPYDLRAEVHTGLLWVFEGITSYYDDLALLRAGLITREGYLELVAQTLTRVLRTRGRFRQSVEESSFDAWTRLYKPDANTPNSTISYYTKGALVALALDLTLRAETAGRLSLDEVLRECWRRWGETGEGMPERGLEAVAAEVSGLELGDFFDRYVRGTEDLPLAALLGHFGVEMRLRAAQGPEDAGGKPGSGEAPPPWTGMNVAAAIGRQAVAVVHAGSPAEKAGVTPGDELLAVGGIRTTAANLPARLREYRAGDEVALHVFRSDTLLELKLRLAEPPEDTCYLQLAADCGDETRRRRDDWLASGSGSVPGGRSENEHQQQDDDEQANQEDHTDDTT